VGYVFISMQTAWVSLLLKLPMLAHRTLITRKLKGLEDIIPYTSVHWHMLEKGTSATLFPPCMSVYTDFPGWRFVEDNEKVPGENVTKDPLHPDYTHLRQIYFEVDPEYKGRFTVPTLYDKKKKTIVNNESSEIIRMFYTEFDDLLPDKFKSVNLYPEHLRKEIDATNEWTYDKINNGVYKSGFATTQEAYENNVIPLFEALDKAEAHLAKGPGPFYYGDHITEADIRLYTTIVRFDVVYVQHFKTNIRDIRSGYPNLHKWMRKLYWDIPAFHDTTQFEHIKNHYTKSHRQINPESITPVGPKPDILKKDEEVPAVMAALKAAGR
jgi:glutathionyl-hydroquinone reductase